MNRWTRRLLMGLSLFAVGTAGCAEERDPINRVQADALAKSFFVGKLADANDDPVFYWRNFVVDGSEAQSMIGIGSWGGVDRVRWEITENMLIARKAYPIADGADDKGTTTSNGTIVGAYPIAGHFDIKRAYNSQTGEELNVIEENSSDRVWYEREYFRVDWSINMVETPLWYDMFTGKLFGEIVVTPLAYYVNDKNHADYPHFDAKNGYFDVTSKFWVESEKMASPFIDLTGQIPACIIMGIYTGAAVNNCDPQEAVVRSSYWRADMVPSAADFEPFEHTTANLDIVGNPGGLGDSFSVGIVTPPRVDWDPQYGYTDDGMKRFMHVHNIWTQSHVLRGECESDAQCGGGACLPLPDPATGKPLAVKACTVACSYDARRDTEGGSGDGTDDQCQNLTSVKQVNQGGEWVNAESAVSGGSQCSARGWCTLPYRDRKIKTVGYWMNRETPAELTDALQADGTPTRDAAGANLRGPTEDLTYSWNQLMKFSVAKAREIECRRTTGNRDACRDQYFDMGAPSEMVGFGGWGIDRVKPMEDDVLVACHNPVRIYDHAICGAREAVGCTTDAQCDEGSACGPAGVCGYAARVGDVRHNFMYYWPYASRAPWGGIANWNADPLTGMIVGGAATTMGRSATYAAAMVRDIIMVANGELSFQDITDGTPATLFERRLQNGYDPEKPMTDAQIAERVSAVDAEHAHQQVAPKDLGGKNVAEKVGQMLKMVPKTMAGIGPASTSALQYEAIAEKVRGSEIEAQLVDNNWVLDAAGMNPATTTINDVLELVSPLRGMDEGRMAGLRQMIDLRMQARGVCFPDIWAGNVGNMDVQGVAKWFFDRYSNEKIQNAFPDLGSDPGVLMKKRAELIYNHLWKDTFKGIALHEVGHSLGMLHQFASSYDSANFNPQYWQLRTGMPSNGNYGGGLPPGSQVCNGAQSDGYACMGPRYLDPETPDELGRAEESRPGVSYFGHTSTMEYQNERFFETVGLGQYDLHTMGFLYGRVLQTFDDKVTPVAEQEPFAFRSWTQLTEENYVNWEPPEFVGKPGFGSGPNLWPMHYTEQGRRMKVFEPSRCRDATQEEKDHANWRIVHGKVCSQPQRDFAFANDFEHGLPDAHPSWMSPEEDSINRYRVRGNVPGGGGNNIRWPFRWGVTSNSYPHTNPSDAGADIFEVTRETIRKFKYAYPFQYFRRHNRDWYYRNVPSRVINGFYERLRAFHWSTAINNARFSSFGAEAYNIIASSDNWWRPHILSEVETFDNIAMSLMMPQIGPYYAIISPVDSTTTLFDSDPDGGYSVPASFELDAATARYIDPDFDSTPEGGGSWDYQSWVNHTGYTVEKAEAARALADGRSVFFTISRENYLDGRNVNINFRTDLPDAMDRLFGGMLAGDWETIAPYVDLAEATDPDGNGTLNPEVRPYDLTAADPQRPGGALLVFPNVGYKQQLSLLVYAHIYARLNGDLGFANKMRIWVDGLIGEVKLADAQQARFTNPESGYTYIAKKYGDWTISGKTVDKGIASRMLARGNALVTQVYETSGVDSYGAPIVVLESNGEPKLKTSASAAQIAELRAWVGLLDASVQIANMVGYGPFSGWGSIDFE